MVVETAKLKSKSRFDVNSSVQFSVPDYELELDLNF